MHLLSVFKFQGLLVVLSAWMLSTSNAQEDSKQKYSVIGKQNNKDAYSGTATLERTKGAYRLFWNIEAPKPLSSQGFGLIHHQRMAVVFGQVAHSLMIFSLHDGILTGKAVSRDNLLDVRNVKLDLVEGTPFDGVFRFLEGDVGELHIEPIGENPLEVAVFLVGENLKRLEGIGLWTGDVLQIAPTLESGELGLMSYTLGRDDAFHGVWTSGSGIQMETLKPVENTKPTPDPRGLPFDKQAYFLAGNRSLPGGQVCEEREYLRMGETLSNFSKKIIIRRYLTNKMNANELSQTLLLAASDKPGVVSTKLLEGEERLSGHTVIIKHNEDRSFHLTYVHRDETYLTSVQLIVMNRFDLKNEDKFAEHIQKNLTDWANEIRALSTVTPAFIRVTASMPEVDTSKAPETKNAPEVPAGR